MSEHELRLVAHKTAKDELGAQPYCICGWIGKPEFANEADSLMGAYRRHLDGVGYLVTFFGEEATVEEADDE